MRAAPDVPPGCGPSAAGHPQFTHVAGVHGSLAASNAILGVSRKIQLTAVPRVTFTDPEVAAVGLPAGPVSPGLRVLNWEHTT